MLHPLQALNNQYLFSPCFGLFCPSHLYSPLPLSDTAPLGRRWVLTGTVKCSFCGGDMLALKLLSAFPKLSFAFWLNPL